MMQPRASMFGGSWINDDDAGSRHANVAYNWPDNSNDNLGARGRSDDPYLRVRCGLRPNRPTTELRPMAEVSNGIFTSGEKPGWSAHLSCFGEHTSRSGRAGRSRRALSWRLSRPAAGFFIGGDA
jgi:RNA-directed DNA polymerase